MSDEPEPVKSVLVRAVESGDLDAVHAAVEAAGDTDARFVAVNAEDKGTWRSPLHWSASFGLVDVTRLLIELGGDPNAEDIKGRTSLHYACDAYRNDLDGDLRYEDGITQLVAHGAFSLEDMTGKLPDAGDQSSGFVNKALHQAYENGTDRRVSQAEMRKKKRKAKMDAIFAVKLQQHVNNASAVAITVMDSGANDGYKKGSRG